jgi:hypothetical protein
LNDEDTNIIIFNFWSSADFGFIVVTGTGVTETTGAGTTDAGNTDAKATY